MQYKSGFALGSLVSFGLGIALTALVTGLEVQGAAMPPVHGIDPATINRTLKGDRLPATAGPVQRQSEPQLPEGCVAAPDWHKNIIYTAEIAGRCVA